MPNLTDFTGIKKHELLNQLHKGLKEVNKILKVKYPFSPQLKTATFKFSTDTERLANGKAMIFVGYEKSKTKKYTKVDSITLDYSTLKKVRPKFANLDYKESVYNIYLEFAGYLMLRISDYVITARQNPDLNISSFEIEDTYSITKNNNGLLGLKFFGEKFEVSASLKKSKIVTHNFKLTFESYPFKKVKKT